MTQAALGIHKIGLWIQAESQCASQPRQLIKKPPGGVGKCLSQVNEISKS